MPNNEFKPFAAAGGANVLSPADYSALAARLTGFANGVADPAQANTPWRQTSVGIAGIAQLICDLTGVDMLDDGSPNNFRDKFSNMLNAVTNAAIDASGSFGSGGIFGLTMANAAANPTTRITISVGQCRNSTNTNNINLATPLTKRLDLAWAAGDQNGGRDTASALANGQTWFQFVILNPTSGVIDALFSQSPTNPTLPAGYTKFRRIGAVVLEAASTAIRLFTQIGNFFQYKLRSTDYAATANGVGPYLRSIAVPVGIKVLAKLYFQSTGDPKLALSGVYDPDLGTPPAFGPTTQWAQARRVDYLSATQPPGGGYISYDSSIIEQFTDTAGHVYTYSNDAADVLGMGVLGWTDDRGRFY